MVVLQLEHFRIPVGRLTPIVDVLLTAEPLTGPAPWPVPRWFRAAEPGLTRRLDGGTTLGPEGLTAAGAGGEAAVLFPLTLAYLV